MTPEFRVFGIQVKNNFDGENLEEVVRLVFEGEWFVEGASNLPDVWPDYPMLPEYYDDHQYVPGTPWYEVRHRKPGVTIKLKYPLDFGTDPAKEMVGMFEKMREFVDVAVKDIERQGDNRKIQSVRRVAE